MTYIVRLLLILAAFIPMAASYAGQDAKKPNVILLFVDDLGWKDVGFMGSRFFETPNIDRLAKQGMIFTQAYASAAICSPTRASLLTGKYPARIGITDWIRARFQLQPGEVKAPDPYEENGNKKLRTPSNPYWMELGEVTLAELMKKAGYFTCHLGKWHLGTDEYYPEHQGYDKNIGGNDMGQPVNYFDPYTNDKGVGFPNLPPRKTGEYLEDRMVDELVTVIETHKDKPFFINMSYYSVHTPLMAKPDMIQKYRSKKMADDQKNAVYAAMIENLDQSVGRLIRTLEQNKLMENTIIIFTSDNGGLMGSTSNAPLRSGKGYPYEGGIRIPLSIYWKGKIAAGTTSDLPVSTIDLMPTICALTKTPLTGAAPDGRDISPVLFQKKLKQLPLYWHFPHYRTPDIVPYSIVRNGDWKLIRQYEGKKFQLFNLKNDRSESNDLSETNPSMVKKLDSLLQQWLKKTGAKMPVEKR